MALYMELIIVIVALAIILTAIGLVIYAQFKGVPEYKRDIVFKSQREIDNEVINGIDSTSS